MKYFTLFDRKSGAYSPEIFGCRSMPEAVRSVALACDAGKGPVAKFPADFDLYQIGEFDSNAGVMIPATQQGPLFIQAVSSIVSEYLIGKAAENVSR